MGDGRTAGLSICAIFAKASLTPSYTMRSCTMHHAICSYACFVQGSCRVLTDTYHLHLMMPGMLDANGHEEYQQHPSAGYLLFLPCT